jgi:hypothetical protein
MDSMKPLVVVMLVALAAVSGCGDGPTISTDQAVTALRNAGFRNLIVLSNESAMKRAARDLHDPDLARDATDVDAILPRSGFQSVVTLPIFAVRHPSVGSAKKAQENDRPFLEGDIPRVVRKLLPASFDPARIQEVRVCNVVVSSYITSRDTRLQGRFDRAIALLRDACR